jgi:hypothetical protein
MPHDTRSRAELKIFDLLRGTDLPGDPAGQTVAYHSLNVTSHPYKRFGEIDFLLCGPRGLIVLEVKGGGVKCVDGRWSYLDRKGRENPARESPFRQAEGALHGLSEKLAEHFGNDALRKFVSGYGVIFPDCEWNQDGAEWDSATLADARGCRRFDKWIDRLHQHWAQKSLRKQDFEPGPELLREVQEFLRPDFEVAVSLGTQIEQIAKRHIALTEDQYAWVDIAEANPRTLCTGGAGTGKTFLAAELARRWTASGRQVLLACASPWLKTWLAAQLPMRNLTIATCDAVATEAGRSGIEQFDSLILDEAQDLMQMASLDVLDGYLQGGLAAGEWAFFGDFQNQSGLLRSSEKAACQRIDACRPTRVPLRTNCRNTLVILDTIKALLGADMGVRGTGQGPLVRTRNAGCGNEVAQFLTEEIDHLIANGLPYAKITVLAPESFEASSVALLSPAYRRMVRALDYSSIRTFPPRDFIGFSRIRDFKGLENDAIIVVDLPSTFGEGDAANAYVGMSRARCSLSVIFRND